MENDPLNFLDGKAEEPLETTQPVVLPEPAPQGEPAAPPAAPMEDRGHIPIAAMLDEREKRQKAEREAEELRRWKAEQEAKQKAPPPDFYAEPDQRLAYERQQFQQSLLGMKLEQSRFLAERDLGAEVVQEAYAYFDKHPELSHQFLTHPSPFHAAVTFYKRQKIADEVGNDPDAWMSKKEAELRAKIEAEVRDKIAAEAPAARRPPVSLASAPAAGRATEPVGDPLVRIAR
jgi:hypothetical protein